MVKSFFHRYFSFSNKVFYPVAYIMNELQHLTTPSSLKFCLALCFSSGPNSSKCGPSCPQVGSNFFHLAKEMATTFLEPERTLILFSKLGPNLLLPRAESSHRWSESSWVRIFSTFWVGPNLLGSESSSTHAGIVNHTRPSGILSIAQSFMV